MRIYGTWQKKLTEAEVNCSFIRGTVEAREPATAPLVEKWVAKFIEEFGVISLSGKCPVNPPIRGPFGLAEIWLKPGAVPVCVEPYQVTGERRGAWVNLVDKTLAAGKLETGVSTWNTPSFLVPKTEIGRIPACTGSKTTKRSASQGRTSFASDRRYPVTTGTI